MRPGIVLTLVLAGGVASAVQGQQAAAPTLVPAASTEAPAQTGGLLTLDPVALYEGSAWFKRVQDSIGAESTALSAENDRLASELAEEERRLTERRGEMAPEDFRARAAEFDARVVQTRRDQEDKARRLTALSEVERQAFFRAAIPVFAEVMAAHKAVVILDRQSVFISAEAVDVTDELLAGIDARLGAGTPQPLPPGMAGSPIPPDAAPSAAPSGDAAAAPALPVAPPAEVQSAPVPPGN